MFSNDHQIATRYDSSMCHRLDSVHVRGENLSLRCSCPRHTPVPAARWHATRVLLLVNRLYRAAYESPTERERHWTTFEVSVEPGPSSSREPDVPREKSISFPRSFRPITWPMVTAFFRQFQGRSVSFFVRSLRFVINAWLSSKCIQCSSQRDRC